MASEIDRALGRGLGLAEVAVFYRTNAQSRTIEDQLVRRSVPYVVVGGPRFYERAEIRDLLAYLRVAANPADGVSLARMLGAPKRGIGPGAVAKLRGVRDGASTSRSPTPSPTPTRSPGSSRRSARALAEVAGLVDDVRAGVAAGTPLDRLLEQVLDRSGLRDALVARGHLRGPGPGREPGRDGARRRGVRGASEDEPTLAGFLEGVALQADADLVDQSAGAVTLMTIHNAKGLEFDTVLITGLEEGLFPHVRSDTPEALEEERRLFYVGLTRARRTLALTHAESRAMHGGRDYRLPSRFLAEIPADCLAEPPGARRAAPSFAGSGPRRSARRWRPATTCSTRPSARAS